MRNLAFILMVMALLLFVGCNSEKVRYASTRTVETPYPIHNSRGEIENYGTFERYMWDEGFPDTIIVPFTRNGKFDMYVEAVRKGLLKDSLGNYYSPAYIFTSVVGDTWTYDIKGKFIEFGENIAPHSDEGHQYNP